MRSAAVILVLLLAGCASETLPPARISAAGPAPAYYEYACPPGENFERAPDVCVSTLEDLESGIDEPYLAIDPEEADRMVIVAHRTRTTTIVASDMAVEPLVNGAYFTEDGGATWRRSELPNIETPSAFGPIQARFYYDPAVAFGPNGTVHVAGMGSNDLGVLGVGPGVHNLPYWTATDDFGVTWRAPVVLDERRSDRTFLVVEPSGRIVVLWAIATGDERRLQAVVTWSDDDGATWSDPLDTDCQGFSPPQIVVERATFACVTGEGIPSHARLVQLQGSVIVDVATIGELSGYRPRLGISPGGGLMVANDADTVRFATSIDAGATWSEAVDATALMALDDMHPRRWLKWADADPWGGIHLLLSVSNHEACDGSRGPPGTCRIIHAAFDLETGALVQETIVSEADGAESYRTPGSLAPPTQAQVGDDFYAFDFSTDHGILLWTRDGGVDLTKLLPQGR